MSLYMGNISNAQTKNDELINDLVTYGGYIMTILCTEYGKDVASDCPKCDVGELIFQCISSDACNIWSK